MARPDAALTLSRPLAAPLQLATYLAFGAEIYAWFCVGEIVGRGGSITGYNI